MSELISIGISLAEKILPEVIKKFIPLVKCEPKKIIFLERHGWESSFSFYIHNRSENVLYDIYIKINLDKSKIEDFNIYKDSKAKNLEINLANLDINIEALRFNLEENGKDFILLKVVKLLPKTYLPFKISSSIGSIIQFKVLEYSKTESAIQKSTRGNAKSIEFKIPGKKSQQCSLKSLQILTKI